MNTDLVHAFFALCWIAFIVFAGVFTYALVRWLSYAIWPIKLVKVNYFHNGVLTNTQTVDLSSDVPLVRQLAKNREEKHSER